VTHGSKLKKQRSTTAAPTLSVVQVVGVRASQMRSIELKRTAPDIRDSITAERIGELPDVTITDALQRVPGVQINRVGGVGSSVDVRGLPEVGTTLNGEVFITPDQIDSQQPDFSTLPATLFQRVDVVKSPTASMVNAGISGSIDLHTYHPWDLPSGFTYSYSAAGERGSDTKTWGPDVSGLFSYNDHGRWGLLLQGDFSNTTRNNSTEGLDQYGVALNGENAASAGGYAGFVSSWAGAQLPPEIHQFANGDVDVNGDGKSNGVFMGSQDISLYDTTTRRRRKAGNASFQAQLGQDFTLESDLFVTRQDQYDLNHGIQFNSTDWQGATYIPLQARNTDQTALGAYNTPEQGWSNMDIYTTQVYQKWPGDVESYTQAQRTNSYVRNFNVKLNFDNGNGFTAALRGVHDSATQQYLETDLNITNSDGAQWQNDPENAAPPGTYIYPEQLGGNQVFNPNGVPQNTVPIIADFTNRDLTVTLPPSLQSQFASSTGWAFKTIESTGNYNRQVGLSALSLDGNWDASDNVKFDFGVRNSIRNARNTAFDIGARVYGGLGATDPNGCKVLYVAAADLLNSPSCSAGNAQGFFRRTPFLSFPMSNTPSPISNNWTSYNNLLGSGVNFWAVNPTSLSNPLAYWGAMEGALTPQSFTAVEEFVPGDSWGVHMQSTSGYLQSDLNGHIGSMSWSGNVGVRAIRTNLLVTQFLTGAPQPYSVPAASNGTTRTSRQYWDILPSANFAFDLTDSLKLRLAYSKHMMPLSLSTWGGGLDLGYNLVIVPGQPSYYRVAEGHSSGNPNLNPWRSTNYDASLEYYLGASSMVSVDYFRINVDSFIQNGNVQNCTLPDEDGVVRNHCIIIGEPVQGTGAAIQGAEFQYQQGFTFLPGLLADTGVTINFTYAPSKTNQSDLAGHRIPFQDNSKESGNAILWFQGHHVQARVAYNYRSVRAVESNVGGVVGLEAYEAPQRYLDASVSYKFSKYVSAFVQGTNLTNEYQNFYLVWPDQEGHHNFFERMFQVGVRGQF
jgi:TonB-dependent receptor